MARMRTHMAAEITRLDDAPTPVGWHGTISGGWSSQEGHAMLPNLVGWAGLGAMLGVALTPVLSYLWATESDL